MSKPVDFDEFIAAIRSIEDFWLTIGRLPPNHPTHEETAPADEPFRA